MRERILVPNDPWSYQDYTGNTIAELLWRIWNNTVIKFSISLLQPDHAEMHGFFKNVDQSQPWTGCACHSIKGSGCVQYGSLGTSRSERNETKRCTTTQVSWENEYSFLTTLDHIKPHWKYYCRIIMENFWTEYRNNQFSILLQPNHAKSMASLRTWTNHSPEQAAPASV